MTPYFERDGIVIYHGDCLEVMPGLGMVDHVITDPPYAQDVYLRMSAPNSKPGSGTPHRIATGDGSAIYRMAAGDIGSFDTIRERVAAGIAALTRRWALVFSDVESVHLVRASLVEHGMRYVRTGVWVKPDAMPQMSGDRPGVGFEPCTIAHAAGPMRWNGGGHAAVWTHNTAKGADRPDHPCPKPLSLMRELVVQFTDPGETILDPFMGSGTTLRAALDLGRRAIGIEIEERWCEAAAKRLSQAVLL